MTHRSGLFLFEGEEPEILILKGTRSSSSAPTSDKRLDENHPLILILLLRILPNRAVEIAPGRVFPVRLDILVVIPKFRNPVRRLLKHLVVYP